jgi:hypothetical protein
MQSIIVIWLSMECSMTHFRSYLHFFAWLQSCLLLNFLTNPQMNKYAMNWTDFNLSQAILISNVSAFLCTQNIFVLWLRILHILHPFLCSNWHPHSRDHDTIEKDWFSNYPNGGVTNYWYVLQLPFSGLKVIIKHPGPKMPGTVRWGWSLSWCSQVLNPLPFLYPQKVEGSVSTSFVLQKHLCMGSLLLRITPFKSWQQQNQMFAETHTYPLNAFALCNFLFIAWIFVLPLDSTDEACLLVMKT